MPKQYLCGQFDVCLYYTRNTQEGNFGKFPRLYPLAKRLNPKAQGFYAHSYNPSRGSRFLPKSRPKNA